MTRINAGIAPRELCDLHLLAEYRELPRALRSYKSVPPDSFRLGSGHVTWCAQYPGWLTDRYERIVAELSRRGFRPKYTTPKGGRPGAWPDPQELVRARPVLQDRIRTRLSEMRDKGVVPVWSHTEKPDWA